MLLGSSSSFYQDACSLLGKRAVPNRALTPALANEAKSPELSRKT
jgi:hypothetical protein